MEEINNYLEYHPETGKLVWLKNRRSNLVMGNEAGSRCGGGYRYISFKGKKLLAHRVIWWLMTRERPEEIDHINGIRDDNRWDNLRAATRGINARNQGRRKDNKSGCLGVVWHKSNKKWCAKITVKGQCKLLGYSSNFLDACAMRKAAEREYSFHPNHGTERQRIAAMKGE